MFNFWKNRGNGTDMANATAGGGSSSSNTNTSISKPLPSSSSSSSTATAASTTPTPSPAIAASPHWKVAANPVVTNQSYGGHQKGFSPFVAFCFTINYILGCGFLSIPWAFVQSGLVLSSILLVLAAIMSDVAKDYVLETMARAEVMLDDQMHWINKHKGAQRNATTNVHDGTTTNNGGRRLLLVPPSKRRGEEEHLLVLQYQEDTDPAGTVTNSTVNSYNATGTTTTSDRDNNLHRSSSLPAFVTPEEEEMLEKVNPYHIGKISKSNKSHYSDNNDEENDGGTNSNNNAMIRTLNLPFSKTHGHHNHHHHHPASSTKYLVGERKFEINALCRVFLQKRGLRLYTIVISLYLCGALWAYTSVFSSAMATALPIIQDDATRTPTELHGLNYLVYAIVFGCVVVPLSCLELDEQVPLQVLLTGCRFLMFFLMIGTSHLCAVDQEDAMMAADTDGIYTTTEAESFQWSGLPKTLPILIFANIFHHSIPGLTSPVADKRKIGGVFSATNAFTTSAYLILGLTLGTAFGKSIHQSSNLNWNTFHAGTGEVDDHGDVINRAWWTQAISMYIILFPAIDVVSAYPLNAITLGNNLFNAAYGKRIHEVEKNRLLRTCFRLIASVPPILLGILVRQLGVITDYTGTTGFLIGLSFPAILYITSRTIAIRKHYDANTYYTRFGSKPMVARAVFWFGIIMMVAVFFTLTFGEMLGLS